MRKQKRQVNLTATGAKYERMPWDGLNIFRRVGGDCPFCCVSLASHEAIGCELLDVL